LYKSDTTSQFSINSLETLASIEHGEVLTDPGEALRCTGANS
jgi:hypothetical protein